MKENKKKDFKTIIEEQGLTWIEPFKVDYTPVLTTDLKSLKRQIKSFNEYKEGSYNEKENGILSSGFLNIKPNYQREIVWTIDQKQQYVLYYLQGGMEKNNEPLVFNLSYLKDQPYEPYFELVDGQQRLNSILEFTNNKFPIYYNGKEVWYSDVSYMSFKILYRRLEFKEEKQIIQYYINMNKCGTIHTTHEIDKAQKLLNELN